MSRGFIGFFGSLSPASRLILLQNAGQPIWDPFWSYDSSKDNDLEGEQMLQEENPESFQVYLVNYRDNDMVRQRLREKSESAPTRRMYVRPT
jgi:hypothetical protein